MVHSVGWSKRGCCRLQPGSCGLLGELKLLNQPSDQLISALFPGVSIGRTSIKQAAGSIFSTGLLSQHLLQQLDSHQLEKNNNKRQAQRSWGAGRPLKCSVLGYKVLT